MNFIDFSWLSSFFIPQQKQDQVSNDQWQMDVTRTSVCHGLGAIPAPWQHQVLQQHAGTARTGLLTKIPIQYLRLT